MQACLSNFRHNAVKHLVGFSIALITIAAFGSAALAQSSSDADEGPSGPAVAIDPLAASAFTAGGSNSFAGAPQSAGSSVGLSLPDLQATDTAQDPSGAAQGLSLSSAEANDLSKVAAAIEAAAFPISGVITSEVTVQTDGYPSRVVIVDGDDGVTYRVATTGGYDPDGDYLVASHAATLPLGYQVELSISPAPPARLDDFRAGGYDVDDGTVLYQVFRGEEGETVLNKVEGVGEDGSEISSLALRDSYKDFEMHWTTFPVPFYLNPAGGPVDTTTQISAMKSALAVWNTVACADLRVRFAGTSSIPGNRTADNGVNLVYWDAAYFVNTGHPYRLGETWRRFDPTDWAFTDVEIVLNGGQDISHPANYDTYDLLTLMAHELGHGVGFGHVADDTNFMNKFLAKERITRRLGQLDIDAVHYLYPGTCFGRPQLTAAIEKRSVSCFSPNGSTGTGDVEIIITDPEEGPDGPVYPEERPDDTGYNHDTPGDSASETSGSGIEVEDPSDGAGTSSLPTDTSVGSTPVDLASDSDETLVFAEDDSSTIGLGDGLAVPEPSEDAAGAVSAVTSEDSAPEFDSWTGELGDDEEWDEYWEYLRAHLLPDQFTFIQED